MNISIMHNIFVLECVIDSDKHPYSPQVRLVFVCIFVPMDVLLAILSWWKMGYLVFNVIGSNETLNSMFWHKVAMVSMFQHKVAMVSIFQYKVAMVIILYLFFEQMLTSCGHSLRRCSTSIWRYSYVEVDCV